MSNAPATIPDLLIIEPTVFSDARGFLFESLNTQRFKQLTGFIPAFVQENHSGSARNVLRGLHYQIKRPQGKLVRVISGEIFDVAVDLRKNSDTFGKWHSVVLSAKNRKQIWIPEGFAHGFLVLSEHAELLYKTTNYWAPQFERCIAWNDTELAITWPIEGPPILSEKDAAGVAWACAEFFV